MPPSLGGVSKPLSDGLRAFGPPLALLAVGCGLGEFPFLTLLALLIVPVAAILFFVQALRALPRPAEDERDTRDVRVRDDARVTSIAGAPRKIGALVLLIGTFVLLVGVIRIPSLVLAPYYRVPPASAFFVHIGGVALPVPVLWLAAPLILAYGSKLRSSLPFSEVLWRFAVVLAVFPLIALLTFLLAQVYPVDA